MIRKDTEKDSERPHYYSQFWLDVAAGRRIIGQPKPNEDAEGTETEIPEPAVQRRPGRVGSVPADEPFRAAIDEYADTAIAHPIVESTPEEEFAEPEEEELDSGDDLEYTDVEDAEIPDMDLSPADEEAELEEPEEEQAEDEFFEEEEEEEEEDEDIGWGGRGRKKPSKTRVQKPLQRKPGKRDARRSY